MDKASNDREDVKGIFETEDKVPEVPPTFRVHCPRTANWVVRKLRELRTYGDHVEEWAAAELRRVERDHDFLFRRFGGQLEAWARKELAQLGGRRKCIDLPAGRVGFRTAPVSLEVVQEELLLEWCRRNLPNAIKLCVETSGFHAASLQDWIRNNDPAAFIRKSVAKQILHEHFKETGNVPAGVQPSAGGDRLYVR